MAELADALVLGASAQKACRFKSCSRHHPVLRNNPDALRADEGQAPSLHATISAVASSATLSRECSTRILATSFGSSPGASKWDASFGPPDRLNCSMV